MSSLRILYVALAAKNVSMIAEALRQAGYGSESILVNSRNDFEAALPNKWDVMIVGISTKLQLEFITAEIRSRNLDIPIVALKSKAGSPDLSEAIQMGAKDSLALDDMERLIPTIEREIVAAAMRQSLREQVVTDHLLHEIDQLILDGCDTANLVSKICQRMVELFDFKLVWIGMKADQGAVDIVAAAGDIKYLEGIEIRWDDTPPGQGATGQAIRSNKPVTLRVSESGFDQWRKRAMQHGMNSSLSMPLGIKGEVIGALMMYSAQADTFDALTVDRLSAFAGRVTVAMLGVQEQHGLRLMQAAMNYAGNAMFITRKDGMIEWVNESVRRYSGYSSEELLGQNPRIFSSGRHDKAFWKSLWASILTGKVWRGDIVNRYKDGDFYTVTQTVSPLSDAHGEITHFLAVQQDITEKKHLEQEIRYLAYHDTLTKLPNRVLFKDRVELSMAQAHRNKNMNAMLFLDLDGFKNINDEYGHAIGDKLLMLVSERLAGSIRAGDTVARLGGDEFTVLLVDVGSHENIRQVADKILERIRQPYDLGGGHEGRISVSIGVSLYPGDGESFDELLTHADKAMYRAKQNGKNQLAFFDPKSG